MRIRREDEVGGLPVTEIRRFFRAVLNRDWHVDHLARSLDLEDPQASSVFGSYLDSGVSALGDVDIAIDLGPRKDDKRAQKRLEEARRKEASRDGRRFSTWLDQLGWPEQEVMLFLKSRSRLSLHLGDTPQRLGVDERILYSDADESASWT